MKVQMIEGPVSCLSRVNFTLPTFTPVDMGCKQTAIYPLPVDPSCSLKLSDTNDANIDGNNKNSEDNTEIKVPLPSLKSLLYPRNAEKRRKHPLRRLKAKIHE